MPSHDVVLHPSPKNDATKTLTVLFYHWIVKFEVPDILVTHNGNKNNNGEFARFAVHIMYSLNHERHTHHGLMD